LTEHQKHYNLTAQLGNLTNYENYNPVAKLEILGTNYTSSKLYNQTRSFHYKTFSAGQLEDNSSLNHTWYFQIEDLSNQTKILPTSSQDLIDVEINKCNATITHQILNYSYYNELTRDPITLSNSYDITFEDDETDYNVIGTFTGNESDLMCINVDPSILELNFNFYGTNIISSTGFITRIMETEEIMPYTITTSDIEQIEFNLLSINESNTITFTWLTQDYQLIDGVMRILKCNLDGTKTLVDSVNIISGTAVANLRLFDQAYSYEVIYQDKFYQDYSSYSKCHVESSTTRTYILESVLTPGEQITGLDGIICNLDFDNSTNILTLTWDSNPEQAGYVQGCIIAQRVGFTGNVEIFNSCSEETDGYIYQALIPLGTSNSYYIRADVKQNGNRVACGSFTYDPSLQKDGSFGSDGLIVAFFLIIGISLLFYENGENMLIAVIIALIISFILSIVNLTIGIISAIVFIILIAIITGRAKR